ESDVKVSKLSKIDEGTPGSISFLSNLKYEPYLYDTQASVVIVSDGFSPEKDVVPTLIYVSDAHQAFVKLLEYHNKLRNQKSGIEPNSHIHSSAELGENV